MQKNKEVADQFISICVTPSELAAIDAKRGDVSRSLFCRKIIKKAVGYKPAVA
jgi:hypothetical protein